MQYWDGYEDGLDKAIEVVHQVEADGKDKYVSLEVYKLVARERDIAIEQLHKLGYEFEQKVYASDNNVRTDWCVEDCYDCEEYDSVKCYCPKLCRVIRNAVVDIEESYNRGWISCIDKLPVGKEYEIYDEEKGITFHKHVLVRSDFKNILYCTAYYDTDTWFEAITNQPIEVVAWKPIKPYQPKEPVRDCNTCANNTEYNEVDIGCYMCCKGLEDNYRPKGD